MNVYRVAWQSMVAVVTIAALAAAGRAVGWAALLGAVGAIAVGGATCGYVWVEDPERRARAIGRLALWFAIAAVLLIGLPELLGSWALLAVFAILVSSPFVVEWLVTRRRRSRAIRTPEQARRLRAGQLELRWLRTSLEVRDRRAGPDAVLALVEERQLLLDELERRDPAGFDSLLVRAGWREPQDH